MGNPSPASSAKAKEGSSKTAKVPLLDSRRLFELFGLLTGVAGLLILLSLVSYQPEDPSLNTVVATGTLPHNWIGPAGALAADGLFQIFGWVAYLLPLALLVVGVRWLLAKPFDAPRTKMLGAGMLLVSLGALLELFPYTPAIHGALRGGGLLGYLAAAGIVHTFSRLGASIVATTLFLTSLFLVTRFSFGWAAEFSQKHGNRVLTPLKTRWSAWQAARAAKAAMRLRHQMERQRVTGKPPVLLQKVGDRQAAPGQPIVMASSAPAAASPAKPENADKPDPPPLVRMPKPSSASAPPKIVGRAAHGYKLPSATLLRPAEDAEGIDENELKERATRLTAKFLEFGVTGTVTQIHPGPVVTTYEFKPEAGIKYSRITSLVDDLCLAMKAESILIDRIPGKSTVGIEVPNLRREIIHLRELVESNEFVASPSRLSLGLGKDVTGKIRIGDLTQMPHLLIAGSTGSGKSVAINSMVVSVLMKSTPEEVKLILIDPKRLELNLYDGVPHLLTPIVTEPKRAANALRRAVMEMDERLRKLAEHGVRNIAQYNKMFEPESTLSLFDNNGEREQPLALHRDRDR